MTNDITLNITTPDGRSIEESIGEVLAGFNSTQGLTPNQNIAAEIAAMIEAHVKAKLENEDDN